MRIGTHDPRAAHTSELLAASGLRSDWSDRQRLPVSARASTDPMEWADRLFHDLSPAAARLLAARDRLVSPLGLREASPESFAVHARTDREVLLGSDDRHLDFRAAVRRNTDSVDVVTVVEIHHLLGRLYLAPVRLVHGVLVRRMLRRAAAVLDPPSTDRDGATR